MKRLEKKREKKKKKKKKKKKREKKKGKSERVSQAQCRSFMSINMLSVAVFLWLG